MIDLATLPFRLFMCAIMLLTVGCSSSKKKKTKDTGAETSRLNSIQTKGYDRKKGEYDHSIRSEYDQKNYTADKKVKDQKFRTDSFTGKHNYTGSTEYKSKEYSQSNKMSRDQKGLFYGARKTPRDASQSYSTKDSRYDSQMSKQNDKGFADQNDTFKTGEVRDAAKSMKKNTKPLMIPKDEADPAKSAYTEADVRRMVNRN
jgi:hypothetical protein